MERRTRLDRLIAVFDRLYSSLEHASIEHAAFWAASWRKARPTYVDPPPGVPRSQLSAGLLQGLREVPLLFGEMPAAERRIFSNLYNAAIDSEYPDFLQSQHERLEKIVSRGRIANESQFYLVRHAIDVIEGDSTRADELTRLYRLVDAFEARHR